MVATTRLWKTPVANNEGVSEADVDLTKAYIGEIGSTNLTSLSENKNFEITMDATHHALLRLAEDQPDFWTIKEDGNKEKFGADAKLFFIDFEHSGEFPAPMTMKIYVGNQYESDDTVYLYWIDSTQNLLEKQVLTVDRDGYITTNPISHASTYVVSNVEYEESGQNPSSSVVPSAPNTGDNTFPYIWMVILVGATTIALLFVRKIYANNPYRCFKNF